LISRIAEGDNSAFTALYERFSASLYGMAFRMMNDAKEAEDVFAGGVHLYLAQSRLIRPVPK
jgi:DNA-directed RNA polymerase specialized sigma24 family protein